MGSVRKMHDGRYQATFYYTHPLTKERERFRRKKPYTSKRKAERWMAERIAEYESRAFWQRKLEEEQQDRIPRIADFVDTFISGIDVRAPTKHAYESRLTNHVVPQLGDLHLNNITSADTDELFEGMRDAGLAVSTIKGVATALGSLLSYAVSRDIISSSDRPTLNTPSLPARLTQEVRFLEDEEVERLLGAAADRIRPMFELALLTGLRVGELQALCWEHIDLERLLLIVKGTWTPQGIGPPKSGRHRTVPLTSEARDLLQLQQESRWTTADSWVFSFEKGQVVTIGQLRSPVDIAFRDAGLEGTKKGWHVLRHTFAARLATGGMSMRKLQTLLGHASVTTTERYAHLMPEATDAMRREMEELGL